MAAILAKEMCGRNITVDAATPSSTATDLVLNGKSPELIERTAKTAALERLARPSDIAGTVSFLAAPDRGGLTARRYAPMVVSSECHQQA